MKGSSPFVVVEKGGEQRCNFSLLILLTFVVGAAVYLFCGCSVVFLWH